MLERLRRGAIAGGFALLLLGVLVAGAAAHALPQSSDPSPGASLTDPPAAVTIVFGERPDPALSSIKVLDTSGATVATGPAVAVPGNPDALSVPLRALSPGVYTVAWRSFSAIDGHLASGSFAFGVGVAPGLAVPSAGPGGSTSGSSGAPGGSAGPSAAAIAGRWLLYLGVIVLVGAGAFGVLVARPPAVVARRLLPLAWVGAAVGTSIVVLVELSDAAVDPVQVLGTSLGRTIVVRAVPLVLAGVAIAIVARAESAGRVGSAVIAVAGAAAMLADVTASHAAAGSNGSFDVAVQAVHILAVGFWLGGLAGLLLTVRGAAGEGTALAARRFSRVATIGIATVALSGFLRAVAEVGTIDGLVNTDFGRLIIAKTGLLGVLAAFGATNHFRNVPRAGRSLGGLRRIGSLELLVGATAVLLAASLVNLAPPTEVAAAVGSPSTPGPSAAPGSPGPSARPIVALGADLGTSVRLRLDASPGVAGFNAFRATVSDYDTGTPVPASAVTLRFGMPARPDIGTSRLDLVPVGPGILEATGANLSLEGAWQVTALVVNGTASVEVPLVVIVPSSAPSIDVNAVAGLPTIYTVHLSAGQTVQVYLDPGTAGPNEVHATFFDAAGVELPVPSVVMALEASGGPAEILNPRQLEPGHFVADTRLAAGTFSLSIAGPAPGGDNLVTQLDVPIVK